MGRLEAAIEFASVKHEGQYRKGGAPYITHPVAVANILKEKGFNEDYQIAGIFHDLLEDTDATLEWYMDFCDEIPKAVEDLEKTL